jgi:hypothetical protein
MEAKGLQRPVVVEFGPFAETMAAMSVVSHTSQPTYTASFVAYYNGLSSGHFISAPDLPHFNPSRPLYYFGMSSKKRGVHLLSFFLPPRHLVQFSTFGTSCAAKQIFLSSPRYMVARANKKKQHWKRKKSMYIIMKAHTLLNSEMWSKISLFSPYLRLYANRT